jgi:CHRD domain
MVERNPMAVFGERRPQERRAVPAVRFHPTVAMLAVAALLAGGPAALASTLTFKAELSGGGEVPPNNSAGKGQVSATLNTDTKTLTWSVMYSGVTGAPIGAHFHGPVSYIGTTSEENAPIQVGTPGSLASPFRGSSPIDDTQMQDLKNGRWYFNLHTPKFSAGEIRGPVVRQ